MIQIISTIAIIIFSTITSLTGNHPVTPLSGVQTYDNQPNVLGESTQQDSVTFNVDAIFNKALIIKDKITADNIVYGIRAGSGVGVGSSDPQNPVITNTGVLSVAGKSGELKLEQGSGITIDGLKITNSGIISLTSGTGIAVSGSTITNSDLGSSQNIFKTISVSGQDDIVAGSNTDTLTFTAGSGITLTTDSTNDKLTISSNDPNVAAGWTHGTDSIYLTTSTDSVGIGTTDPSYKLHVVGTEYVSDTLTAGGALGVTGNTTLTGALSANGNVTLGNATTDSLTFIGRIANGTSLIPDTDLGSNLGTETNRFNNLWVANINSNSSQAFSGQTTFSYAPQDTTTSEASVFINPASSVVINGQLLGFGVAGYQKALIDSEGDMILGYSNTNVNPTRVDTEVLSLYGHSGTKVAYVDTSGNLNITGGYSIAGNSVLNATTLGTGILNSSLTSTGTLNSGSITSGFGSIDTGSDNIVTTGTVGSAGLTSFTGNSLAVNSITSTGDLSILPTGNVGIGTSTPTSKLTVVGDIASSVATGVEGLKLTDTSDTTKLAMKWTGTGVTVDTPSSSTVNKLSNGTFETNLTGWTANIIKAFQPSATTGQDTSVLSSTSSNNNYGIYNSFALFGSSGKSLLEFDTSSISSSVTLNSATLYLYRYASGAAGTFTVTFYSVASGNADWPEGTKNGSTGTTGDSSWNYKDVGLLTPWAGSAGLATSGTDYEVSVLGSFTGDRTSPAGTEYSTTLTTSRVQSWLGTSNTNYGLLFSSNVSIGTSGFCTSDHTTAAYRPKLVLDYSTSDLTGVVSLDTNIKYSGSSSAKAVVSTDGNFDLITSATLPDTSTYNLTAYAYTDGSAVTTADLDLYYDTDVLTTTYTSVGNGWYKLSGTLTGVASAKNYGVRVKAGKTVYVDNLSLFTTSGGSTVLAVGNSTTGLGGLSVESTTTLNSGLASLQALIVKGFSGQTEDLTEWQDSTGSVLASISPTGGLTSAGNLNINGTSNDIAGTLNLSGNSLTSSGALSISPTAGSNISFSLSGTGDMIVNTNDLVVDTSLGYVGIGTAAPTALLDLAGTSGVDAFRLTNSGAKVLGLSYGTNSTTFDQTSTDPTNKLLNGTFDTDLTSWSEAPSYTLNDEFSDVGGVPAGSVNGTSATPTGGTRTVTDTGSKISISGGKLTVSSGVTTYGDPGIKYPSLTRGAGKAMIWNINKTTTTDRWYGGLTNNAAGVYGNTIYLSSGNIQTTYGVNGNTSMASGTISPSTDYQFAVVLRTSGAYYYVKGGEYTNWTLLNIDNQYVAASLYPAQSSDAFAGYPLAGTFDNIRIPTSTWLPTPLAYDDFASADMTSKATGPDVQTAPQLAWTGGSDAGGVMTITPSLGSESLTDGGLETWASATDLTNYTETPQGTTTINQETSVLHGGSNAVRIDVDGSNSAGYISQGSYSIGKWLQFSVWARASTTGASGRLYWDNTTSSQEISSLSATDYNQYLFTGRTLQNNKYVSVGRGVATSKSVYLDDFSVKELTLSSLFSTVSTSDADVIADADVTVTAGTQAGIVTNLNDTTSPTDFRIIYTDGTSIKMDDVVGGTYTNKLSVLHSSATALNYAAGRTLRVITQGTTMRVYYNNTLVGSEITTLGANTNTKHGLFSTYELNSFDNFTLWPRGTGGEFEQITPVNLTATRETTIKYNNSTASVKLVATTTDADYVQSVNVGDTSTYNLIAYAYTTGAAVTSADLSLYYDTGTITTTYAPMGATGWYKLTGTLTGVASAKDFGVRVKAGKTVYVDEMHLQVGTGTNQTMYVLNSNTGVTGLNVQGLINGTLNGVATFSKAGTISDADFAGGVTDGMMAIDTTNHRVYFREGGSWSYSAKAGGFQIPKEEVLGLSTGDYLLPYVDNFMSDGAVHGLYQKFDLNKLLATQGAVTFVSDVTFLGKTVFNKDTAGTAIISTYSNQVDIKFDNTYDISPIITMNLVIDSTDSAFIEEGQKAYLTNVSPTGFSIMLPSLAMKDFMYKWIAIPIKEKNVTKSQPVIITPTILP